MNNIPIYIIYKIYYHIYKSLFIHSSVNEHLGYFYLLATGTNAALNISEQISVLSSCFPFLWVVDMKVYIEVQLMVNSKFNFYELATVFSTVAAPFHIPTKRA